MTTIFAIAFGYCAIIAIANLRRTLWSLDVLEQHRELAASLPPDPPSFVVLIPCLREQAIVDKLVTRMQRLDYPAERTRIYFVTTARERPDASGRTTRDHVAAALAERQDPRLGLVHCTTGRDTCKADQLNFALHSLGLDDQPRVDTFVGVFDADSAPDPRVLRYVAARRDQARAFQQIPLYSLNLHRLPRTAAGWICRSRPLHNALFALTMELPEMTRQTRLTVRHGWSLRRIAGAWLSHAIGHGEFFRHDLVLELGSFRPPSCDTQFGHALAYAGIPLAPIPLFDLGETPHEVRILKEQGVVWFNSMNTFPLTWRFVRSLAAPNYSTPAAWAMTARLVISNVAWAIFPWLFVASMIGAVAISPVLALAGVAALALYLVSPAIIAVRFSRLASIADRESTPALTGRDQLGMVLAFPVEKLFATSGPWLFAYRRLAAWFGGRPVTLTKTERTE